MQKLSTDYLKSHMEYVRKNGVSHDPNNGIQHTLDFQDAIGTATNEEIFDAYQELGQQDRKTFIFASCASLGIDMAENVVKATFAATLRKSIYEEAEKEFEGRELELYQKKQALDECRRSIYKRISSQRKAIEKLEARNEALNQHVIKLQSLLSDSSDKARRYQIQSDKYEQIRTLLAE